MSVWCCSWDAYDLLILNSGPARGDLIGLRATCAATVYKALIHLVTVDKVTDGLFVPSRTLLCPASNLGTDGCQHPEDAGQMPPSTELRFLPGSLLPFGLLVDSASCAGKAG